MGKCNEQRTGHAKVDLSLEMSSLPEARGQIRELSLPASESLASLPAISKFGLKILVN